MARIGILGGGITGLSSAYYLKNICSNAIEKIVLLESAPRVGGWIESSKNDEGKIFECGPRSLRAVRNASGVNIMKLTEDLGLSSEVLAVPNSSPAAQNRFIYMNGKIHTMPSNVKGLFKKQSLFTQRLIFNIISESIKRSTHAEDDSIHDFITKRFGNEVASYAIDPLCRGVYAGSTKKLSIRSCFPPLYEALRDHGSLVKGMMKAEKKELPIKVSECDLALKSKLEGWNIWSFRDGMQQLPITLKNWADKENDVDVKVNTKCTELRFTDNGKIQMLTDDDAITCDHVLCTLPAHVLSTLLPSQTDLRMTLSKIPSAHVASVNLEYHGNVLPRQGFGHLIPSSDPSKNLGVVYDSCVFPEHNDKTTAETTRITVMLGGDWFEELFGDVHQATADHMLQVSLLCVEQQLGITDEPKDARAMILQNAIPQYHVGHSAILSDLEDTICTNNLPISLLGSSYKGVSVGDCVLSARHGVEKLKTKLDTS